jgi:hypothetical protein
MPAPLPLTNVAEHNSSTSSISFTSFRLPALKLSCVSFSYPRPLFSIVCGLFCENIGGGIPLPALHGSHLTSHKSRLSPDFRESPVTSHQSGLAKSFGIRSYAGRPILHYFVANKSFSIRSYGHPARNPFRIRSYKKPGGVAPPPSGDLHESHPTASLHSVPPVSSPAPTRSGWQIFFRRVILFLGIAAREA